MVINEKNRIFVFYLIFINVSTNKKENKEVRVNIRLTLSLREKYKKFCLKNDLDMSKHLRDYIEDIIKVK